MQKVYSANQIASLLGIPYSTVRSCMDKGILPYFTLPGSNQKRVLEDDFITFKEETHIPDTISKGIIVEIGQKIMVDENGHLTTYRVLDVQKNKITVALVNDTKAYNQSRIGGMI